MLNSYKQIFRIFPSLRVNDVVFVQIYHRYRLHLCGQAEKGIPRE